VDTVIEALQVEIAELQDELQKTKENYANMQVAVHQARDEIKELRNHDKATILLMEGAIRMALCEVVEKYQLGDIVFDGICKAFNLLDLKTLMRFLYKALRSNSNPEVRRSIE